MKRLTRFVATPFGLAVGGLLVLAGWAALSAGIFDNAMPRPATSSPRQPWRPYWRARRRCSSPAAE